MLWIITTHPHQPTEDQEPKIKKNKNYTLYDTTQFNVSINLTFQYSQSLFSFQFNLFPLQNWIQFSDHRRTKDYILQTTSTKDQL